MTTSIPIYYVNLGRSSARKEHMQRTFGQWGALYRVPAVDASNTTDVQSAIDTHNMGLAEYAKRVRATGVGSLCLLASDARAIKQAYDRGEQYMLLLEDDISDVLTPYWRWPLDTVVEKANAQGEWHGIQMQLLFEPRHRAYFESWKLYPDSPFFPRDLLPPHVSTWGAGATLFSRKGMQYVVEQVFVGTDGKFDCLPKILESDQLTTHVDEQLRCHPDGFFYRLVKPWKVLLALPPLFTTKMNEGSTGIRGFPAGEGKKDAVRNDHEHQHFAALMDALTANLMAKAYMNSKVDFPGADPGEWWYMAIKSKEVSEMHNRSSTVTAT